MRALLIGSPSPTSSPPRLLRPPSPSSPAPSLFSPPTLKSRLRPLSCSLPKPITPNQSHPPPPNPQSKLVSLLLPAGVSLVVAASLFFAGFRRPALAAPSPPPPAVETSAVSEEEKERTIEEYLDHQPHDVSGLKALMEVKIKLHKMPEAIDVLDRLILLEPEEKEWPLLRAHLFLYSGDVDTAVSLFEEAVAADPLRVEAYHGLAMATSQSDPSKMDGLLKKIEAVMEKCKEDKKKEELRDLKLLVAQIRVIEGKYDEALRLYNELVKENPRDFRPYLCQGIIYTLLRNMDEAEKQFDKYKRLVPKGHPYARYFDDNVLATKVFSQFRENEKMGFNR